MTRLLATVTSVGLASIQDGGRPGRADVGVPVSGAWHGGRYRLASELVAGVSDGRTPTVELLAGRLGLRVNAELSLVVVGPAEFEINGRAAPTCTVLPVAVDDDVDVRCSGAGPVYVAIAGWCPPLVLGSAAYDSFSGLGGRPISVGDQWHGLPPEDGRVGWFGREVIDSSGPIRVVTVTDSLVDAFGSREWRVQQVARSGIRLRSAGWRGPNVSVPSTPMVPGAVQLTPDGEAIVLGPDGGLTGGYPVVAVVATVDLDRLSTVAPGDDVRFAAVSQAAAVHAFDERPRPLIAHPDVLA